MRLKIYHIELVWRLNEEMHYDQHTKNTQKYILNVEMDERDQ